MTRAQAGGCGILVDYTGGTIGDSFGSGTAATYAPQFLSQIEPVLPGITDRVERPRDPRLMAGLQVDERLVLLLEGRPVHEVRRHGAKAAGRTATSPASTRRSTPGLPERRGRVRRTCGRGDSRRPEVTACGTLRRGTCGPTTAEACWPRVLRSPSQPRARERAGPPGRFRDAALLQLDRLREPGDVRRVHEGDGHRRPQVVLRLQRGAAGEAEERRPRLRPRRAHRLHGRDARRGRAAAADRLEEAAQRASDDRPEVPRPAARP